MMTPAALQPLLRGAGAPTYAPGPVDPPPEMKRLAQDFEASMLAELIRPMFEALETDGLGGGGEGERMFRPMLVEQYARGMAQAGGVGLADMVVREMMKMQEVAHGAARG
jgi:Rod binding domain-containing protein